ncbi:uncharacterized protein LOC125238004 [Leguminivora glycinivorella]|uniref:uncharacterized protein LOC125238004 n=1 Tax=Leguminivora glycinivorella TaxID=1035111 RepID=UPI002010B3B8|nr:uncharacterized protein LOC125238004 [Leguminivora glycinivorella]
MVCLRQAEEQDDRHVCVPGKFYKDGCKRCFCSDEETLNCGPVDCKSVNKLPRTHEEIHSHSKYSSSEQHKLPVLKYRTSACTPGVSYRVDCNTCLCLSNGNLQCGPLLCPSHDDVHRSKAKHYSGLPCTDIDINDTNLECLFCQCIGGTNICDAKPNCVPSKKHDPIDIKSGKKCTIGMVYKQSCNKCFCTETRSLQCTLKSCLSKAQSSHTHRIRKHWVDYTLRNKGKKV